MPADAMKVIAFHLPTFHPFAENDAWWGIGFTEWDHLHLARPVYPGHRIRRPHPDVGYYDLRERAARARQAELARKYGVHGFCYHHYWFNGRTLLGDLMDRILADGEPDLPFCLNWANESWTRRWCGTDHEVLIAQTYGAEAEWDAHLRHLLRFFRHRNYIRVDGKPMLLVYRAGSVPDFAARLAYWRREVQRHGFPDLHVVMVLGCFADNGVPVPGVDAVAEFQPMRAMRDSVSQTDGKVTYLEAPAVYEVIDRFPRMHPTHYRGVFAGWDNSPRRGAACTVFRGCDPELFGRALRNQARRSDGFVFVNAWNEWGEQAVLEPDDVWGCGYLEAVRDQAG